MSNINARPSLLVNRIEEELESRREKGLMRELVHPSKDCCGVRFNLKNNDYLDLAQSSALKEAAHQAIERWGCSASASPLLTGYIEPHIELEAQVAGWHGFPFALVWNTGYSANRALLGLLPQKEDIVLADRLIHNSMISGILKSGARLLRYGHCDLDHLRDLLRKYAKPGRQLFVVTESVFSMDGDYPDLRSMAALKREFEFCWIVDEAHALGWYGKQGSGLVEHFGVAEEVDLLIGTLGKGLGSMGAYTLFHNELLRNHFINFSGEFIYSTYLAPACAAAASKAIELVTETDELERAFFQERARAFCAAIATSEFPVKERDSSIVPVIVGREGTSKAFEEKLKSVGILVSNVRPPTVPKGQCRLRLSLKRSCLKDSFDELAQLIRGVLDTGEVR